MTPQGAPREAGRLLHYADELISAVYSVVQGAERSHYAKPRGLWVSVEGEHDWREWCEAESFGDPSAQICHEIVLTPDANVLRLTTANDVHRFTREYGFDPYEEDVALHALLDGYGIRWERVAEKFGGIIIAPYQWDCRHHRGTGWYYGWDCASGCIWDASAIASIRALAPHPTPADQ